MIHYRMVCAVIGFLIALVIVLLIRKDRIHPFYTIWWLLLAGCVLTLGFFPSIIDFMGRIMGIHYPPILLIVLSLGFIAIKMLKMDIERTRLEQKLRRLIQNVAMLEAKKTYHIARKDIKEDEKSEKEPRPA